VADHLVVEGNQDQRAEQRDRQQEVQCGGGAEAAAAQQPDVDRSSRPRVAAASAGLCSVLLIVICPSRWIVVIASSLSCAATVSPSRWFTPTLE